MSVIATGIGRTVRRREDPRLLSGQGRYSDDLNLPGQAYAIMLRSPHARLRAIDTAAARDAPGVLAVLTGRDMLADGLHPIPHAVWSRHPAELDLPNSDGSAAFVPPHYCMATDEVRHVGEIVAVVVATSAAVAKDAAELVTVAYDPLPALTRALEAVGPGAVRIRGDGGNICVDSLVGDADATEAAFARAAHVATLTTWIPRVTGVPKEPRAALGTHDPATGRRTPARVGRCGRSRTWLRCWASRMPTCGW
jgi:carbon-monoxide dehydrogenase large subunit